MFLVGLIIGLVVGYYVVVRLSGSYERYDVIEEAARNGSKVCINYLNEKYGDFHNWEI
jgi:hypothetical protein